MERLASVRHVGPSFADVRGEITNILEAEGIRLVTLITSKRGTVRGDHYHKIDTQHLYVVEGGYISKTRDVDGGETHNCMLSRGSLETCPPFVAHRAEFFEPTTLIAIHTAPRVAMGHSDTFKFDILHGEPL